MKKQTYIVIIFFVILSLSYAWWYNRGQEARTVEPELISKEKQVITYVKIESDFNAVFKRLLIAIEEEDGEEANYLAKEAYKKWAQAMNGFFAKAPAEYRKTNNWEKYLSNTEKELEKIVQSLDNKNFLQAEGAANQILFATQSVREENKYYELRDKVIKFKEPVDKVASANSKAEISKNLEELKIDFTILKAEQVDKQYENSIIQLENIIATIDRQSDGPELKTAQKELASIFRKLYLQYG